MSNLQLQPVSITGVEKIDDAVKMIFVRSGVIELNSSVTFKVAGQYSFEWSSHSNSTTNAYNLLFDVKPVYPSSTSQRFYSFPLRCLSTVLDI